MKLPSISRGAIAPVDFTQLAKEISQRPAAPGGSVAYAPPKHRPDAIVEQVLQFGDLPTKELDDIIAAAENEIAALKADAQAIRDMYSKHTQRVVADVKHLQSEVKLSMNLMKELRKQCGLLDANATATARDWLDSSDRETEADTHEDLNR